MQRKHSLDYDKYIAQKQDNALKKPTKYVRKSEMDQQKFDDVVMRFIIKGLQPLRIVEDESFIAYTNGKCEMIRLNEIKIKTKMCHSYLQNYWECVSINTVGLSNLCHGMY